MLEAIVFDFDGVLANSEPLHFLAFRDVLAEDGLTLDEADYYARYLGFDDVGAFEAIARDRGRTWTAAQVREAVARKAVRMEILERDHSALFPGAADAVRRAAARLPIAIASGALGAEILRVLEREGLRDCFTAVVSANDTPASKPAPDPYLLALSRLSSRVGRALPANRCVALEDSLWGLQSARRAGLRTVAVAQTYRAETFDGGHADLVIASIGDLDLPRLAQLCAD